MNGLFILRSDDRTKCGSMRKNSVGYDVDVYMIVRVVSTKIVDIVGLWW